MREASITDRRPDDGLALRTRIYRYFFYGWMFRDADSGSGLERSAALRHNAQQARWLPTYMRRWFVSGLIVMLLEITVERLWGDNLVSAFLALVLIFAMLYEMITTICWAFLQLDRQAR